MDKKCWQITVAAFVQPLQYDLRSPAAKDNSITHAAVASSNLEATITMRSAKVELQNTMEFHRQLLHQHHLQSHLHCGNDPTVANHNGIPSATHPAAPLAIPFTLREQSCSCKSPWNSVDRTHTKNSWSPIYNAEPIREWSEHDPSMIRAWSEHIRPHTRPSRTRRTAEVDHRGSRTDFVWKNIGFRTSAISQKRIWCETSSKTPTVSFLWLTVSLTNCFFDQLFLWLTVSFLWLTVSLTNCFFDQLFLWLTVSLANCFFN